MTRFYRRRAPCEHRHVRFEVTSVRVEPVAAKWVGADKVIVRCADCYKTWTAADLNLQVTLEIESTDPDMAAPRDADVEGA